MAKLVGFQGCWLVFFVAFMVTNLQILLVLAEPRLRVLNHNTTFMTNYEIRADREHVRVLNNGSRVQLILDKDSASGFGSKYTYLFGKIGMRLKLVPGNSAGTVTAYYLSSQTNNTDEIDFEFLGNVSGQPYILQTNVFAGGQGEREQRIYLWFDPTADFHEYSVLWNKRQIVFYVDDTPIRIFKNNKQRLGMAYPDSQPMRIFTSIWNGENWATNNGWVKLNWTHAPFIATYEKFNVDACVAWNNDGESCIAAENNWWEETEYETLDNSEEDRLKWVSENFIIYNYCTDQSRNPKQPAECELNV